MKSSDTFEPQYGKLVAVRDYDFMEWVARVFVRKENDCYLCIAEGTRIEDEKTLCWKQIAHVKKCFDIDY